MSKERLLEKLRTVERWKNVFEIYFLIDESNLTAVCSAAFQTGLYRV